MSMLKELTGILYCITPFVKYSVLPVLKIIIYCIYYLLIMAKLPNLLDQMATSLNISSSTSEEFNTPGDSINVDELSGTFVEKISLLLNENSNGKLWT